MLTIRATLEWLYIQEAYDFLVRARVYIKTGSKTAITLLKQQFLEMIADSNCDGISSLEYLVLVGKTAEIFKLTPKPLHPIIHAKQIKEYLDTYYSC